jgi:hypothetical protein
MNATVVSQARQQGLNNSGAEIQPIRQLRQKSLLSIHNFNALGCLNSKTVETVKWGGEGQAKRYWM